MTPEPDAVYGRARAAQRGTVAGSTGTAAGSTGTGAQPGTGAARTDAEGAQPLRRAFLALGSNLGDRWAYLRAGVAALPDVVAVSSVYETAPVGGPDDQGPFLNCVAELSTSKTPRELLEVAHAAERAAHRVRVVRWGPRTLDVDVLLVGDLGVDDEDLVVPHPRMWERGFVLVPLAELAPELVGARLTAAMRQGVQRVGTL